MKFDTDTRQILDDLEDVSKRFFGRKYRLPVAAVVAGQESPVWARQVARALGIGENQAASELSEFEHLGALQLVPASYDRRKVYQRVNHHFWGFVRKSVDETACARGPTSADVFWSALAEISDPERFPEGR